MAHDWVKMRVSIANHPKTMAIADFLMNEPEYHRWSRFECAIGGPIFTESCEDDAKSAEHAALRVTRYVTVCALLRFWAYANEHSRDEKIAFVTPADVDEIAGVPAFGRALQAVGWLVFDAKKKACEIPNFSKYNVVANDRTSAAERQKAYRERQKALRNAIHNASVTSDVTSDGREEKRREEKKEKIGDSRKRFVPPSSDEVAAYVRSKGYDVDASKFCDYYTANGWKVGKNPMKDWQAAVRTWAAKSDAPQPSRQTWN